ncbi:MAG: DUF190 domain-containing protein [Actinobacteria bacterium]|nr:DUF190 domain-containing protein [Actinomycetota bacterium]
MVVQYNVIEIFVRESERRHGTPLAEAIVKLVRDKHIAARCLVSKGIAGAYENGDIASSHVLDLSSDLPLKIEIILPAAELDRILPDLQEMVRDGIVAVEDMRVVVHRTHKRLLPRGLRVRDAMTPGPASVNESVPLAEVLRLLLQNEFNGVPVVDRDQRVVGIITQGDLVGRAGLPLRPGLLAGLGELSAEVPFPGKERPAGEVMSRPVVTISADEPLERAVDLILKKGLKRLPVITGDQRLVGMLSRIDVLEAIAHHAPRWRRFSAQEVAVSGEVRVGDASLHDIPRVAPDTPVSEVLDLIANEAQRVVVVDGEGHLVGVISDGDLFELLRRKRASSADLRRWLGLGRGERLRAAQADLEDLRAREVMEADPVCIEESALLEDAAVLMTRHKLKRLPVVDAERRYVGMLTREALLFAGCRPG